ncbi:MAG: serine/threonine-protein kinase [Phycisphaerales bacterium]|jgi:hypothetical protein|nr:serine/threonine-protein kinase [Phycisphaerales bacterium]
MTAGEGRDTSMARRAAMLYERLADLPGAERAVELERIGGEDPALRARLERMLRDADALERSRAFDPAPIPSDAEDHPPASDDQEDPALGARFDGFEIIARLASGGMGDVYRARQSSPSRQVALKVFRLDPADRAYEHLVGRIEREAELLARLDHPNIAPVYVAGFTPTNLGGRAYLAMKLIDGETIDAAALRAAPEQRVRWIVAVARALHSAHQRGVVHRDVKPGNIMVDRAGHAYLLDFSLGKSSGLAGGHTRIGVVMGTQEWMSPEQLAGHATPASDVYALGLVTRAVLGVREGGAPRTIPGELERAIRHATQRDPALRPGSAEEWANELERALARPHARRRAHWAIAIAALVVLTMVGLWLYLGASRGGVQPDRRWRGLVAELAPTIDADGAAGLASLARDRWARPLSQLGEDAIEQERAAQAATERQDFDDAVRAWAHALVQRERLFGASDPATLRTAAELARALALDRRPAEAFRVIADTTDLLRGAPEPGDIEARASWALGLSLLAEGRWTTGVANLAAAYEGMRATGRDGEAMDIARDAARAYESAESFERAAEWWARANGSPEMGG